MVAVDDLVNFQFSGCSEPNEMWESPEQKEIDTSENAVDSFLSQSTPKCVDSPQNFEQSMDPTGPVEKIDGFFYF